MLPFLVLPQANGMTSRFLIVKDTGKELMTPRINPLYLVPKKKTSKKKQKKSMKHAFRSSKFHGLSCRKGQGVGVPVSLFRPQIKCL